MIETSKLNESTQRKVDQAIRLLNSYKKSDEEPMEIAYSGGKDSAVLLWIARQTDINWNHIYRLTGIDNPGTTNFVKSQGAIIHPPLSNFWKLIEQHGFPSRIRRFCCRFMKEYKIYSNVAMGIRKDESSNRNRRYNEPVVCRNYGGKNGKVNQYLPMLNFTNENVREIIVKKDIPCHPKYYNPDGSFNVNVRLGCLGCPISRIACRNDFKKYPRLVYQYIKHGDIYFKNSNPENASHRLCKDVYELFMATYHCEYARELNELKNPLFGTFDAKSLLEEYYQTDLTIR